MNSNTAQPETANGTPCRLFPVHRDELERSGLSEEDAKAAGIYSESDQRKLAALMNRKTWSRKLGGAIVFPYRDATGAVVQYRVKPDVPPLINGKPAKYLSPSGGGVRVYFPPGTHERIEAGAVEIVITEGEKKALAITQAGFCGIGLSGVDCWHRKKSNALLPDLDAISWRGRTVRIVFDSDAASNANVKDNESLLAAALELQGAKVSVVRLPSDDGKVGADDFIVKHGAGEFKKLLDSAEPADPVDPETVKQPAGDADPSDPATAFLESCRRESVSCLRYHRGSFVRWAQGCYREIQIEEVRAAVVKRFKRGWFGIKSRHVSDALEHIKSEILLPGSVDSPAWLEGKPAGFDADECLATRSAIIHLPSFVANRNPAIVPATPRFFNNSATDFDLDQNAPRPDAWFEFLDSVWSDDQQSIEALQELLGYLLTSDTRQQKIFLLVGPKRSGKGTIARVIRGLVGADNIAAPTLSSLATNFGLSPLIGKSVGIISDARLSGRPDQGVIVERLLSISGEDAQTIDRKHQSAVTCKLPTRFVVLSNELPRLNDASGAVISRMILLHTTRSFYGCEDHGLTERLLGELPGILLWAIQGWQRLRQRGRFIQPDSALESLAEMGDLASPVSAFVRDRCEVSQVESVVVADLFEAWQTWCRQQGREKLTGNVQGFGRDLLAAEPTIRRKRIGSDGNRQRVYEGIGLKNQY